MKADVTVKFDDTDLEILSSEKELAAINGGGSAGKIIKELLDLIGIEFNNNCSNCNDNCSCSTNNK